ncbi:Inner membrane protein YrbG, predicted calcium/sodium:proton antiporter [hydrothermal vent metagenome]|uniref:Inner membrane protein YrbG, predicted calcium/sodium:proton antiporter n=1 Tax=hydrothermal vent metagenome TaxID=652676 RepID=A0A3B0WFX7_9ZZZZ
MQHVVNFSSPALAGTALLGGLTVLILGGEMLISGAIKIAARLRMSSFLIGLTVVAFGTSLPELFVSLKAAWRGHPDIMLGNIVGSNIANIGLVLAIAALLYPLTVRFKDLARELYLLLTVSLVLLIAAWFGYFPRPLGILFIALLIIYTIRACRVEGAKHKSQLPAIEEQPPAAGLTRITLLCGGGLLCMWFGSDYFIKGAVDLARLFGLPEMVIGLTMAAVGTSLPELASSISAIRRREGDIVVGNILGSNLFNLLMVMGCTGIIIPFKLPASALQRDIPIMTAFVLLLLPASLWRQQKLGRAYGALLLILYIGYIFLIA